MNHVFANIGGIYLTERYEGDPRPSYEAVAKEKQQRALKFMMTQVKDIDWIENKDLLKNFTLIGSPSSDIQTNVISRIVDGVSKLPLCVAKTDKNPYTPEEYLNEVYNFVWATTLKGGKTQVADRKLQDAFVSALISKSAGSGSGGSIMIGISDAFKAIEAPEYIKQKSIEDYGHASMECDCPQHEFSNEEVSGFGYLQAINYTSSPSVAHIYYGMLQKTKSLLEKNINHPSTETRNHYQLLLRRIEKALK